MGQLLAPERGGNDVIPDTFCFAGIGGVARKALAKAVEESVVFRSAGRRHEAMKQVTVRRG